MLLCVVQDGEMQCCVVQDGEMQMQCSVVVCCTGR